MHVAMTNRSILNRNIMIADSYHMYTVQCLQTGNRNGLPKFENNIQIGDRIHRHHQVIIYTYRFNCCGNITEWGADVYPGPKEIKEYSLDFQVWRPSLTVNNSTGTGCYSLVGNNRFTSISLSGGLARLTPSPQNYIQFQPNDVLGFYVIGAKEGNHGIVVQSNNRERVWHASIAPKVATLLKEGCPYPWPAGSNNLSVTLTRAAPVISISTRNNTKILASSLHQLPKLICRYVLLPPSSSA